MRGAYVVGLVLYGALAGRAEAGFNYPNAVFEPMGNFTGPGYVWHGTGGPSAPVYHAAPTSATGGDVIPNVLLVFIPGTRAASTGYENFFDRARLFGYHVISLPFWNRHHVWLSAGCDADAWGALLDQMAFGALAPGSTPANTYEGQAYCDPFDAFCSPVCSAPAPGCERANLFDWDGTAHNLPMHPSSSVTARLVFLLKALAVAYPGEGWDQYLGCPSAACLAWPRITVAGHSLGASLAGYIGSRRTVRRVIMLAGPGDSLDFGEASDYPGCSNPIDDNPKSPSWIEAVATWATPVDKYYALVDTEDLLFAVNSARFRTNWKTMSLAKSTTGTWPLIDDYASSPIPWNGAHGARTSFYLPGQWHFAHTCVGVSQNASPAICKSALGTCGSSMTGCVCTNQASTPPGSPNTPPIVKAWDHFLESP